MSKLHWAILGTGNIARQFAVGLNNSQRNALVAVGSRGFASAQHFAQTHRITAAYGSYEAALADPTVHAVYISLPNGLHHEWTLKALRAGKHVLCEKPFAANLAQAQEMFAVAAQQGRLLMEAFMYRSHPLTHAVRQAVADGAIGRLCMIRTSFLFSIKSQTNVRFDPALAGGSLMDVGCYCLNFSRFFAAAEPESLSAIAHLHPSGVDDYVAAHLRFPGDLLASFTCGMTVRADNTASLLGEEGYITIPIPWKPPVIGAEYTLVDAAGTRHTYSVSAGKDLYALEADDFAAAALDQAPLPVTPADTLGNQQALDQLRRQMGLSF